LLQVHDPISRCFGDLSISAFTFGKEADAALGEKRVGEFQEFR
jgi:hypothetical protein